MTKETILVTGGMGYIGSHMVVNLLECDDVSVIILDNLCHSKKSVLEGIYDITQKNPIFIHGSMQDEKLLEDIFHTYPITTVIHFAGLKSVFESQKDPLRYYNNNVAGSINLFKQMQKSKVFNLIFSSSATVYGHSSEPTPFHEDMPVNPINVYGRTKAMVEQILHDLYQAQPQFNIAILRYFNPVGAHPSGMIGDDPLLQPNNLMPMMSQIVANDDDGVLKVFGSDYPTPDGTAQRDYIHVQDLIAGHMCALHVLNNRQSGPPMTLNLGTGRPYSVLEMLRTFEEASQKKIPYQMAPRREGDSPCSYADVTLAKKILGWEATLGIDRMCKDSWRFQRGVSVDRYLIGK